MAAFQTLFEDDQNENNDEKFMINKAFAKKYQKFKECQELDRLKEKYGDVGLNESELSSSEEEDEDAEALTPQLEEDFMKTLSMIKSKDPIIYKKESQFYTKKDSDDERTDKQKKEKPMFLKDYERHRLIEKGDKAYLSDSDSENENIFFKETRNPSELTYNEEQNQLKKSIADAAMSEDEADDDDFLHIREKTSEEQANEENEYNSWLSKEGKSLDKLGHYWNSDKDLDENEKFLRDYILKRQFVANEDIPSYKDVVGGLDTDEDEEEEAELEREEEFERKFNFRYEEPDQEFIKKYPRTIADSVRCEDDTRKTKRKERDERKKKEMDKKKEELKRLKNLKRKEIMEKIEKLKEITGNSKVGFFEEDMDKDFDASKYDEMMQSVFNGEYYDVEDEEKPEFSDDGEVEENWDEWTGQEGEEEFYNEGYEQEDYEPHCEDEDFNMDADYIDTRKKNKQSGYYDNSRRGRSKFAEALKKKKPVFDPNDKTFEEYFDEYYKLDFEDIIGDMPVRFKYRNCLPNNYGLTTEEILNADDKELNEWCSLKRTLRYNTDQEERMERQKYKKKSRNKNKKSQVLRSLVVDDKEEKGQEEEEEESPESLQNTHQTVNKKSPLHTVNGKSKQLGLKKKTVLQSKFSRRSNELHRTLKRPKRPNTKTFQTGLDTKQMYHRSTNENKKRPCGKPNVTSNDKDRRHNKRPLSNYQSNSSQSMLSNTKQKKLRKQFKGANTKAMEKISINRLAAYGLDKRKKKLE